MDNHNQDHNNYDTDNQDNNNYLNIILILILITSIIFVDRRIIKWLKIQIMSLKLKLQKFIMK